MKTIDFARIDSINFETDFNSLDTSQLEAPIESDQRKEILRSWENQVWSLFSPDEYEQLIAVCTVSGEWIIYGYTYGRAVVPIKFNESQSLSKWTAALGANSTYTFHKPGNFGSRRPVLGNPLSVKFIKKRAPNSYKKDDWMIEKNRFIESYVFSESMRQEIDIEQICRLWRKLVGIVHPNNESVNVVKEPDFEEFEKIANITIPEEVKAIYRICDGLAVSVETEDDLIGNDFLSFDNVVATWKEWNSIFGDFGDLEELANGHPSDGDFTLGYYFLPKWVPIVDNHNGNYIAVDLMPGSEGKIGQIIEYGADISTIRCLAANLTDYIQKAIDLRVKAQKLI